NILSLCDRHSFMHSSVSHQDPHSFPTRRSSDLRAHSSLPLQSLRSTAATMVLNETPRVQDLFSSAPCPYSRQSCPKSSHSRQGAATLYHILYLSPFS